jgi:hypothetical protein
MTKSTGVGRTGRPKSTPPGPGIPGTVRTAKPGTVEAIEEVLALMAVENDKPTPNLGRQRSYSAILEANQNLLNRADADRRDCTRNDLNKTRADIKTYGETVTFLSDELRGSALAQDRDRDELRSLRAEVKELRLWKEDVHSIEAREAADLKARTRAAAQAEQDRLVAKQLDAELEKSEAECAEIDSRHRRESLQPGGPPDIGREGTEKRAAWEEQQAADNRARQRLEVLRRKKKMKNEVDKENRNAVEAQER